MDTAERSASESSMELFYVDGNVRVGPIGKSQFQALIQAKTINAKTLVWQPGMAQWEELGTFLGRRVPGSASAQPLADTLQYAVCCECENIHNQQELIHVQDYWVCGGCKPIFLQKIREGVRPQARVIYANYGSLEKGINGDFDLSIFEILSEGWRLTHGSKAVIIGSLFLVWVISGLVQNIVFLPLPFIIGIVGVVFEEFLGSAETTAIFMGGLFFMAFIVMMVLSIMVQAPLWAGLEMIGVRRSVDLPISFRYVFDYFKQFLPLALTALIVMSFVIIGFVLLIIPGIYVTIASFLAIQLVADKKMGPWSAFKASVRAITYKWFQVFLLFIILLGLVFISIIPCGVGLIWTWPLFVNTKGVLYRNIFGVNQTM
jgi:hypothetical protein